MDVTIIVPTYNRRDTLLETLRALNQVDYPLDRWEAVVVDDGSTDDTQVAVKQWIESVSPPVRFIRQSNAGPSAARNRGGFAGRGEVLIFIDNDIIVRPDFIRRHLEALAANPGCWILGRITHPAALRETPFGRYRDDLYESFYRKYQNLRLPEVEGMSTQNVSMPAEDFKRLGGFDESFTIASGEDWELAKRARQLGIRVLYDPEIVVLHDDWAISLEQFCRRHWLYSYSDVLLYQKYGEASQRGGLVRESASVNLSKDGIKVIVKKGAKRALATAGGKQVIRAACRLAERFLPDTKLNRRTYEIAVAVAIFEGVRAGIKHYGFELPAGEGRAGLKEA